MQCHKCNKRLRTNDYVEAVLTLCKKLKKYHAIVYFCIEHSPIEHSRETINYRRKGEKNGTNTDTLEK